MVNIKFLSSLLLRLIVHILYITVGCWRFTRATLLSASNFALNFWPTWKMPKQMLSSTKCFLCNNCILILHFCCCLLLLHHYCFIVAGCVLLLSLLLVVVSFLMFHHLQCWPVTGCDFFLFFWCRLLPAGTALALQLVGPLLSFAPHEFTDLIFIKSGRWPPLPCRISRFCVFIRFWGFIKTLVKPTMPT